MFSPDTISSLTSRQLDDLAKDLLRQAWTVHLAAAERREIESTRERAQAAVARLREIPGMVIAGMAAGQSYSTARDALARSLGTSTETINAWWKRHRLDEAADARAARDATIFHLARIGLGNVEIGRRVGLHPNSVSRIIRVALATSRALALTG